MLACDGIGHWHVSFPAGYSRYNQLANGQRETQLQQHHELQTRDLKRIEC